MKSDLKKLAAPVLRRPTITGLSNVGLPPAVLEQIDDAVAGVHAKHVKSFSRQFSALVAGYEKKLALMQQSLWVDAANDALALCEQVSCCQDTEALAFLAAALGQRIRVKPGATAQETFEVYISGYPGIASVNQRVCVYDRDRALSLVELENVYARLNNRSIFIVRPSELPLLISSNFTCLG